MDPNPGCGFLRRAMALIAGAMLVASHGMAQDDASIPAVQDSSLATSPATEVVPSGDRAGGDPIELRSSVTLGTSRSDARARDKAVPFARRPVVASKSADLRLQRSLVANVPSTEVPKQQALPAGELNRDGIVRATRVQIREGMMVLEGDGKNQQKAAARGHSPVKP